MTGCPLCGHEAKLRDSAHPGYVDGTVFQIYNCTACDAAFAEPRHGAEMVYENIYRQSSSVPGYMRYGRYAHITERSADPLADLGATEDVYWAVAVALRARHQDVVRRRVLEVGSGYGYLSAALARRGYDVTGIDISASAVGAANARFSAQSGARFEHADLEQFSARESRRFHAVIACEVIEHIPDPIAFVRAALALLEPTGQLIVTTPNRSLFESGVIWETDPPPVHFWWYSEKSISAIGDAVGANVQFIDFSSYQDVAPLYVNRRLPTNVRTRGPLLDHAGVVRATTGTLGRARVALADALPVLRTNSGVQRLLGRRRVRGPRRTILCAIFSRASTAGSADATS